MVRKETMVLVDFPYVVAIRHTFAPDAGTARSDGTGAEPLESTLVDYVSARSPAEIHRVPSAWSSGMRHTSGL